MVELECPRCKKLINIPKGIDTKHYDGIVVCQECGLWLDVKLVGSKVRKIKVFDKGKITFTADDYAEAIRLAEAENRKLKEG